MNFKRILATLLAIALFIGILVFVVKLSQPETATYSGLSSGNTQQPQGNTETITSADGQIKNVVVANDPAFNPRSFTAGGDGWLLSVTESQPKVFTGKLLANDGMNTYDIFLQEADNFYTGDAKDSKNGEKLEFSIQKQAGVCKDKEGTSFEYSVIALFQNQTFNGCGGNVVNNTST